MTPTRHSGRGLRSEDLWVEGDGCLLAVRDYGGSGEPLLLLHGAGASLLAWRPLAHSLTVHHRVLAMDLRAHGRSAEAPWSWQAAVADVDAVLTHLGIDRARLIGHSLGGMLAVAYAASHTNISTVIAIDSHSVANEPFWRGRRSRLQAQQLMRLRRLQETHTDRRFTGEQVQAGLAAAAAQAETEGRPAADGEEALLRCLAPRPDGTYEPRPGGERLLELLEAVERLDVFALYDRLICPLLVVCTTAAPVAPPEAPWLGELRRAHSSLLRERLTGLARCRPDVRIELVDSSHARVLLEPRLHSAIEELLTSETSRPGAGASDDAIRTLDLRQAKH